MSKYLLDVMPAVTEGKKARRLNWPAGKYITSVQAASATIGGSQVSKTVKVDGTQVVAKPIEIGGYPLAEVTVLHGGDSMELMNRTVLVDGTKKKLGWTPDSEERVSMDWEVVE